MFTRKDSGDDAAKAGPEKRGERDDQVRGLSPSAPGRAALPAAGSPAPTQFRPEIPRRVTEIPGVMRSPASALDSDDTKKLIVGREIRLSGEITACEKLVVEGRVEANLSDSRIIEISTTGYFKGNAEVDEAIISGEFQGKLNVRGRLFVRSTGKVSGDIRYGELEIERGGRVTGDIDQNGGLEAEPEVPEAEREAGGAVAAEAD